MRERFVLGNIVMLVGLVMLLATCTDDAASTYDEIGVKFKFNDTSSILNQSVNHSKLSMVENHSLVAQASQASASFDVIDDVYTELGLLVGSYTPTEFRLNVSMIYIYEVDVPGSFTMLSPHRGPGTEANSALTQANFIEDVYLLPDGPIEPGFYDGMGIVIGGWVCVRVLG